MEKIFHVAVGGDIEHGYFGTLYDCADFIMRSEGVEGHPDPEDPLETLHTALHFAPEVKYKLEAAEVVIPKLITIDEALRLKSLPPDMRVSDVPDWLSGDHDNAVLKEMVEVLSQRLTTLRLRGLYGTTPASPFTASVYDALLQQLS